MSISRRTIARAGALALGALTFAACKDSSTAPLQVTPDVLETMGENVATQIEGAISTLTAQDVMNSTGGAPSFRRMPQNGAVLLRGLSLSRSIPGAALNSSVDPNQCGVPSEDPPVDSDGDLVPDDWTLTFALPACHIVDQSSGSTVDITGSFHIADPTKSSAGFGLNFGLTNFKIAFSGSEGSGYVSQNGSGTVTLSSSVLQQTENWNLSAVLTGVQSASASVTWNGNFTAAQGQQLTAGHALPDGSYSPNGSFAYHEGNRVATFSIQTIDALQYNAACAANVQAGTALSPFTAGRVHVSVSNQQNSGYVEVTYSGCNAATVTLVQ
jgi:hypothetical protein